MKILVVPSWYPPNGGRFFKLQAEALAKLGHEVDVLILEEKGITQKMNLKIDASKSILVNEIRHTFFRIPKLNNLNTQLFVWKYKRILETYLKENEPDIIHIHSAVWAGVVVSEIAKAKGIPFVITEHRSLFFEEKWNFSSSLKDNVKLAFKNAEKVLVVSESMKKALKPFSENLEIEVLPNMIDTNFFTIQKDIKKDKKFTFLSVGNLIEVKGFDVLIKSFSELVKMNKKIQLKIIGEGANEKLLRELVNDLGLSEFVFFEGYKTKEEIVIAYNEANVFVSSSFKETFGVVLIEAMACGLPIVATKSGGPVDIVNEQVGYLAEVNNASSLQLAMQNMIDNYGNFESENIRQNVIANYSEKVVSEKLENQFIQCLKNKKQ